MLRLYTIDAEQLKDRYDMILSLEKEKSVVKKTTKTRFESKKHSNYKSQTDIAFSKVLEKTIKKRKKSNIEQ